MLHDIGAGGATAAPDDDDCKFDDKGIRKRSELSALQLSHLAAAHTSSPPYTNNATFDCTHEANILKLFYYSSVLPAILFGKSGTIYCVPVCLLCT